MTIERVINSFPLKDLFHNSFIDNCCQRIIYWIAHQDLMTIEEEIDASDNLNYAEPRFGLTALAVATMAKNYFIMKILLRKGADPSLEDFAHLTPLHYAAALEDEEAMLLLQEAMHVERIYSRHWKVGEFAN